MELHARVPAVSRRYAALVGLVGLVSAGCATRSSSVPAPPRVEYNDPADEQLVEVPATSPAPMAPAPAAPAPQPAPQAAWPTAQAPPAQPQSLVPTLNVLAVAVRPPSVSAGGQVQLVINYEVGGIAAGSSVSVTEERQLVYGNNVITTLSDTVSRAPGPYTASKPVTVPATAAHGLYHLRARVYVGGVTSGGTAVFEVR